MEVMKEKMNVILDSDPGHDDAVAILLAGKAPEINLLGISTCSGNQSIEKTTTNALNLCQYLHLDVPVAAGSPKPLFKEPMYCPQIHGESGLDGFTFPPLTKKRDPRSGSDFIIDTCSANTDVILVPTGPLTNIALALQKEPKIKSHIKEIMLMGGSIGVGNVTPAGEFNIVVDPEAAQIAFSSGLPIYMNGLDVTRQVLVTDQVIARMEKIGNQASDLFAHLMKQYNINQKKTFQWPNGGPLHDPVTVVSLLDPSVVSYEFMNVDIDVSKGPSYGRTNCDRYGYLHRPANTYVAVAIDQAKYWDVIEKVMRLY
jgi:ribosylpyrimidine nucleosidase